MIFDTQRLLGTWKNSKILGSVLAGALMLFIIYPIQALGEDDEKKDIHVTGPLNCYVQALGISLTAQQSILLCNTAKTLEPIRCCHSVAPYLTKDQSVNLCGGVDNMATSECFYESLNLALTFDEQIKLCSGAKFRHTQTGPNDTVATASVFCFLRSNEFRMSQDQRVILCSEANSDDPVRCLEKSQGFDLSLDQRIRLCTQLTPSGW